MAGMSLSWHDINCTLLSEGRMKVREWILFDFVDPPRHAALKAADRILGRNVVAIEKKPIKVKITGRKYMVVGMGASSASMTTSTGSVAEQTSPTHVFKKRKIIHALTTFEAIQAAHIIPTGK
ncbi:hypothetical protein Hanom_Chr00s000003g01604071 [Helianthus anomalus]